MRSRRALPRRWTRVASYAGHVHLAEEARGPHQQHAYDEPQRHRELEVVAAHGGAEAAIEHAARENASHRAIMVGATSEKRAGDIAATAATHDARTQAHARRQHPPVH